MSNKDHSYYEELIAMYLANACSKEEAKELLLAISMDDEIKSKFEESKKVWEFKNDIDFYNSIDVAKAEEKLNKRIEHSEGKPSLSNNKQSIKKTIIFSLSGIAASILLFFAYQNFDTDIKNDITISSAGTSLLNNTLEDGSVISLNKASKIIKPENFDAKERRVELTGEAYFDISPDASRPFIVETNDITITVLGTKFNIKTLPDSGTVEVTVQEGKVQLSSNFSDKKIILTKGENVTYASKSDNFKKTEKVDPNFLAWKSKALYFDNTELKRVAKKLEEVYGVTIVLQDELTKNYKITANFEHDSIDDIFVILKEALGITYRKESGIYYLNCENCDK